MAAISARKTDQDKRFTMPRLINIAHFSKKKKEKERRSAHLPHAPGHGPSRVSSSYAALNLPISCRFILFSITARAFVEQTSRSPQCKSLCPSHLRARRSLQYLSTHAVDPRWVSTARSRCETAPAIERGNRIEDRLRLSVTSELKKCDKSNAWFYAVPAFASC